MGVCYYELGKYDDAIGKMKEALQYQPRHQIAHLNLGIVNLTAGKHDEAITWWKKAVEINPATEIAKRAQEFINSH
jgi:tetratricopeptide (TPR) repeat protein